jgi:hypothetical protein
MMDDLAELIENLRKSLRTDASFTEAAEWWGLVTAIELHLEYYDRVPGDAEREAVEQLKSGVTSAIVAIRDRLPSPSVTRAQAALLALQRAIERT